MQRTPKPSRPDFLKSATPASSAMVGGVACSTRQSGRPVQQPFIRSKSGLQNAGATSLVSNEPTMLPKKKNVKSMILSITEKAMNEKVHKLAKMIDHSILHPTMTDEDLKRECAVAKNYGVASVCVKPYAVPLAVEQMQGSDVLVGCVVGFPAGNSTIDVKVYETERSCNDGAVEIDMVINIGKALQGDWEYVEREIRAVTDACHNNKAVVKVIFETDYVRNEQDIVRLCEICTDAAVDYVKTSTGFGFVKGADGKYSYEGATIPNLKRMKASVGPRVKVKAAGGVRTLDQLIAVQELGCERCGATATATILEEAMDRFGN